MLQRIALFPLLALAMTPLLARAQSLETDVERRFTPAQMREAGLDALTPAQLAALNRLLRETAGTRPADPPPGHTPPREGNEGRSYIGLDDQPIHSRVQGSVDGWAPGTVFVLENGQQWKVLKGEMKLRKPLQAPEIVVVPGIAGRWFLQVDEDMPKARVYRID